MRPKAFPLFPVQDTLAGDVMTEGATFTSGIHDCAAPSIACVRNRIGTELSSTHSIAPSLQTSTHSAQAALFLGKRTLQNTTDNQKTALRAFARFVTAPNLSDYSIFKQSRTCEVTTWMILVGEQNWKSKS